MTTEIIIQKLFVVLRKNWLPVVLVFVIVGILVKGSIDKSSLMSTHEKIRSELQEHIKEQERRHLSELEQRDIAIAEYQKKMKEAQEKYNLQIEIIEREFSESKTDLAKKIVREKQFGENKELLAEQFIEKFGFSYVP